MKKRSARSSKAIENNFRSDISENLLKRQKEGGFSTVVEYVNASLKGSETLGDFVYRKRLQANVTQKDLGNALGFSTQQYVSNLERGLSLIAPQYLETIAEEIKCSHDELMALYFAEIIRREVRKVV